MEDILSELEQRVEPLRQQSETAREYLALRGELRGLELETQRGQELEMGVLGRLEKMRGLLWKRRRRRMEGELRERTLPML